jgi:hypothetical protein
MKTKTFTATVRKHISPFGDLGRITSHHLKYLINKKVKVTVEEVRE